MSSAQLSPVPSASAQVRVLIIDDDPDYAGMLSTYLAEHGLLPTVVTEPARVEGILRASPPDIVLLDQRLGETTGTQMLLRLRATSSIPCIIVTGFSEPTDRIINLELGADDELSKSASPRELLARIRTVLRRCARSVQSPQPGEAETGGWTFSTERRELLRPDGRRCHLTTAEYETFRVLHEAAGCPVSRQKLSLAVFGRNFEPTDRAVDTVIRKLRRKLNDWPNPRVIKTVRPLGYVFTGFR